VVVTAQPEITQRDLRNKSKEIMDAVEGGQAFTVVAIAEELPLFTIIPASFAGLDHLLAVVPVTRPQTGR
jgi:hypothetical protein